jgi:hypothetical protein
MSMLWSDTPEGITNVVRRLGNCVTSEDVTDALGYDTVSIVRRKLDRAVRLGLLYRARDGIYMEARGLPIDEGTHA